MAERSLPVSISIAATLALVIFNVYLQGVGATTFTFVNQCSQTVGARTFTFVNQCSQTVWPAGIPVGGGTELGQGATWTVDVPAGTANGRFWGRTGCSFDASGRGSCTTGDCGGALSCTLSGQAPTTLVEYNLNTGSGNSQDFYDISVIDGYNLALSLTLSTVAAMHQYVTARSAQMPTYFPPMTLRPTVALLVLLTRSSSALEYQQLHFPVMSY